MSHDKDCAHDDKETEAQAKVALALSLKEMEARVEELTAETETLKHDKDCAATEHHDHKEA